MGLRQSRRAIYQFQSKQRLSLCFSLEKACFLLRGNIHLSGSTGFRQVSFEHFQVKLVGVKIKNILKNAYFLLIFATNHSTYTDSWILWNFNEFQGNLLEIQRVNSMFRVYGMYGMCSAFSLKVFSR